jgi:O-antigen/teichoic acid export membrane protein
MFAAVKAGDIVPRLGEGRAALQVLVVTIPLYAFSAIELHLRSAEGRNRVPVALGAALLVGNVALNLLLVGRYAMVAAAWVLVACELAQAGYLASVVLRSQVVGGGEIARAATAICLLGVTAGLLSRSDVAAATVPAATCLIACTWPWIRRWPHVVSLR